jgi:hypothetical protein
MSNLPPTTYSEHPSRPDREQRAWRAFMDHATACDVCLHIADGCEDGQALRRTWRETTR